MRATGDGASGLEPTLRFQTLEEGPWLAVLCVVTPG